MSEQQTFQCPNPDCENVQIYSEDEMPKDKRCPECNTVMETFAFVDEDEIEAHDDFEDEEPDFDYEDPLVD